MVIEVRLFSTLERQEINSQRKYYNLRRHFLLYISKPNSHICAIAIIIHAGGGGVLPAAARRFLYRASELLKVLFIAA